MEQFALGRKIPRKSVESNTELIEKIIARANFEGGRQVGERTAIKRYVKYINNVDTTEEFAHLFSPDDSVYFVNEPLKAPKNKVITMSSLAQQVEDSDIEIKLTYMKDKTFDPSLFVPIRSGKAIDKLISNKEGLMPATNTIILGDPGIGKTTVMLDLLAAIQKENPEKKCLFVSGEMTDIDLAEYMERIPGADEVATFFTMDYDESCHIAFLKTLKMGWDVILLDSFDEVKESLNEDLGLTSTKAEKWLINVMIDHNQGKNDLNKHSAFLAIQQVTKGGKFVGSNKLKHNTTAMLEIRYDHSTKQPKMFYTKNRRGNTDLDMYFTITSEGIDFHITRFIREQEFRSKIEFEEKHQEKEDKQFKDLFGLEVDTDGNYVSTEKSSDEIEDEIKEELEEGIAASS